MMDRLSHRKVVLLSFETLFCTATLVFKSTQSATSFSDACCTKQINKEHCFRADFPCSDFKASCTNKIVIFLSQNLALSALR